MIDARLSAWAYRKARGGDWGVDPEAFSRALDASIAKGFAARTPSPREIVSYVKGLHLRDLALACACAAGDEDAWTHFVTEFRPALYRAADGLEAGGGARELADALYADLYGLKVGSGGRQSLFRYFHGRSSLATWLRAVLAQRHVDKLRERRRTDPLPDEDAPNAPSTRFTEPDPDRTVFVEAMRSALSWALARLAPNDRLRVACYYAWQMTLAQVGRLLGEHEATVSRNLARTRREVRAGIEHHLADEQRLTREQIDDCFRSVTEDAGSLDLREFLGPAPPRKELTLDRSNGGEP
jgi:RNA polymerase sigma-70 factor (ECF subfamily)